MSKKYNEYNKYFNIFTFHGIDKYKNIVDKKIYKKMDKMNNLSDLKKQIKNEIKEDLKDDEEGSKWCFLL